MNSVKTNLQLISLSAALQVWDPMQLCAARLHINANDWQSSREGYWKGKFDRLWKHFIRQITKQVWNTVSTRFAVTNNNVLIPIVSSRGRQRPLSPTLTDSNNTDNFIHLLFSSCLTPLLCYFYILDEVTGASEKNWWTCRSILLSVIFTIQ